MKLISAFHCKNALWMFIIVTLLIGIAKVNVASASSGTHFWVDPPYIAETPEGKFRVNIAIADAPPTWAWEFRLSWDPDRLELNYIKEGEFLRRGGAYLTSFVYVPFAEANVKGEIRVACSLRAVAPPAPPVPWASGNGTLCTLGFIAEKRGDAYLDLFETILADHLEQGYPAFTLHANEDGLVTVTNFYYAGCDSWKLKVNGKAGVSEEGGLKTTVGTGNLLEAYVRNTGTFDVYVQVLFEIRDSGLGLVAAIKSSIVSLPAGSSNIFSATWTAGAPDIYRITAYSFYGPTSPPTIPDGFSKTVRLKAV